MFVAMEFFYSDMKYKKKYWPRAILLLHVRIEETSPSKYIKKLFNFLSTTQFNIDILLIYIGIYKPRDYNSQKSIGDIVEMKHRIADNYHSLLQLIRDPSGIPTSNGTERHLRDTIKSLSIQR